MPRPRLLAALAAAPASLVEAPGGYGKSTLAAELAAQLEVAQLEADVIGAIAAPPLLAAALRRGALRAGLSDLAHALEQDVGEDPAAAAALLAQALAGAGGPLLVVVDEAQHVEGPAAETLAALTRAAREPWRLLVLGRRLPGALDGAPRLDADDLAFEPAEADVLLRAALGRATSPAESAAVYATGQGWPALTSLLADRMAREAGPEGPNMSLARRTLALLVDDQLAGFDTDERRRVAELARLPLLSPGLVDELLGVGGFERLLRAGLPLAARRDGWHELPGRLREELAGREPLSPEVARSAARTYTAGGELATAVQLLAGVGDGEAAASLLAGRSLGELDELGLPLLLATLALLPDDALRRHPAALLQAVRVADLARVQEQAAALLERAGRLLPESGPRARELGAERAVFAARHGSYDESLALAAAVLERVEPGEAVARGRALQARALVGVHRGDGQSLAAGEPALEEAAALFAAIGEQRWRGDALATLAFHYHYGRCDLAGAAATMSAALACLPGPTRDRAGWQTFHAEIAAYGGDLAEAEAALREAEAIGRALGDRRIMGYAAWTGAGVSAVRGDLPVTLQRLRLAERQRGVWFEHGSGVLFLAEAATLLARLGAREEAYAYLERADARATAPDLQDVVLLARGTVESRFGDPAAAEQALRAYEASEQMSQREEWRVLLERAFAARRRSAPADAAALAARAFAAARAVGVEQLAALHEPELTADLAPLASAAGSEAASAAEARTPAIAVQLLGGFGVTADGRPADPPPGHPATLVKLLAVARGPVPLDVAVEGLWPDTDLETGRRRLRNVLNRVRSASGELVLRQGEALVLAPAVEVDLQLFEREARQALEAAGEEREGLARTALARYTGELLPADRYAPWSGAPRDDVRRRVLDVLDLLTASARERGEVDEAIRLIERGLEVEPADEVRYLACAELLLMQGRRGGARDLVDRALALRLALGIPRSARLERLVSATRSTTVPPRG